jgi:hypothetical protein
MAAAKLFDAKSDKHFPLSRTKVELFLDCPRCFYLDRRLGIGRPAGFPFNLNSAVRKPGTATVLKPDLVQAAS